jgi:AcrR family transcriptional regulator
MSTADATTQTLLTRPKRADARRNYETVLAAAREAFAEGGESTALEEIARRAGVGIGTLYRHFPNRQALLEAVYLGEVEEFCRATDELPDTIDPWDALTGWFDRFVAYLATKRALAGELLNYMDMSAELFKHSRAALWASGEPLLARAQEAGVVRDDVQFGEVMQMVMGISKVPGVDPEQTERMVRIALDGLRYRP